MAKRFQVTLEGTKEFYRNLDRLHWSMQKKVATRALRAGCRIIRNAARANLQAHNLKDSTGILAESLAWRVRHYPNRTVGIVGPKTDVMIMHKKHKRRPSNYAHLVEDGFNHRSGRRAQAHPFMRPAYDAHIQEARAAMERVVIRAIEQQANFAGT